MTTNVTAPGDRLLSVLGLQGKRALIVGGGLGMGKESARLLAMAGASVAVLDVDGDRAQSIAGGLTAEGGKAIALTADALDPAQVAPTIRRASDELGGLDILVTIVGMPSWASLIDLTDETFDTDLSRNMRYALRWAQGFARHLAVQGSGGVIVHIASVSGLQGSVNHGAYGAAKAGLISLVKTMALEWGERGIRVNAVAPGATTTDRVQRSAEINAALASAIPLGRPGDQSEIAKTVLFLASDLASYVTGQTIVVDGGATVKPSYSV